MPPDLLGGAPVLAVTVLPAFVTEPLHAHAILCYFSIAVPLETSSNYRRNVFRYYVRWKPDGMPGLKKLIHNIRLGREKKVEACPPTVEEKPALKRANARLRKRTDSSVNIRSGLGVVHSSFPIRDFSFSRQNSFEPGQSIKDFDISALSRRDVPVIGPSKLASADGSAAPNRPRSQRADEEAESAGRVFGRYGLEVHPINLSAAAAKSALERRSLRQSKSSIDVRPTLKVVNADPEDIDETLLASPSENAGFDSQSQAKLPSIHNLDWSQLSDDEARDIAHAYDAASSLYPSGSSRADSGIAMSRSESGRAYSGKGKARQRSYSALSQRRRYTLSDAVAAWAEAQAEIDGGVRLSVEPSKDNMLPASAGASSQNLTLDLLDSPERSIVMLDELHKAFRFEKQRLEEEEGWLANAWEIETLRYQSLSAEKRIREREERLRAQIELQDRIRKEQEDLERWRDEQLLQQALRDIEEEERLAEEERRLAEERARLRDCCVCGDSQDRDNFPAKPPAAGCEHLPSTCKECLEAWMASEVETKGCDGIKCPECSQTLEYQEVQQWASQETFATYDKLTIRNALGSLDEFAWCLKAGCGSGQLNIDNNHFMDCASCGYKQCLRHKVPWHSSETCEQYDYRVSGQKKRDEEKEEEGLNKLSKKCPGPNCGWRIEKIDGCEHMTCKKCKHQFCWICLADHLEIKRVGNTAHDPSCKFHSTNLDLAWPFNMH